VKVDLKPDMIVVSRPSGLALSTSLQTLLRGSGMKRMMFDSKLWGTDQEASFAERQTALIAAAADALAPFSNARREGKLLTMCFTRRTISNSAP